MRIVRNSFIVAAICATALACEPTPLYEEYVPVAGNAWSADSSVSFEIEIEDTTAVYQAIWHLRNNDDYEWSNIYLFRNVTSERGIEFADTAQFVLADNYGKWLGKGVGELKTNSWPFKNGYLRFKHSGKYTFTLQQAMRTNKLKGVEDVGLGIYKLEPKENGKEGN